jgi:hypothetical protein
MFVCTAHMLTLLYKKDYDDDNDIISHDNSVSKWVGFQIENWIWLWKKGKYNLPLHQHLRMDFGDQPDPCPLDLVDPFLKSNDGQNVKLAICHHLALKNLHYSV